MHSCMTCLHHIRGEDDVDYCARTAIVLTSWDSVRGAATERIVLEHCIVERMGGPVLSLVRRAATGRWPCARAGRFWTPLLRETRLGDASSP